MMIRFIPSMKHYGKNALIMSNEELDITSASQLVECIRDGYIPVIPWMDTKIFLYEMMYQEVDNGLYPYKLCIEIIDSIAKNYFSRTDYM